MASVLRYPWPWSLITYAQRLEWMYGPDEAYKRISEPVDLAKDDAA
jgi:hypothetical protein